MLACAVAPRGTIGAILLRKASRRVLIEDAPPELAAYQAGIRPGDELLLIEGQDVRQMTDEELRRSLSGRVGQEVQLTLVRGEQVLRLSLARTTARRYSGK